ncbi:MAG TPA: BACON domain-containing carbohydrate-binding protein [Pyrinomonadaceae bacterium]|jgi:hypothetical protein
MKKASFIVLRLFCLVVFLCVASQSQAQTTNCTYTLNQESRIVSFTSGGGTINITTQPGCSWEWRTNNPTWLTAENTGGTTVGNGFLTYHFAGNTGPARTGTLTIAGLTFTINQVSGCSYSLSSSSMTLSVSGGSGSFSVAASDPACSWRTVGNADWITVTSSASSTGNGIVNFNIAPNTGAARTGTISVGDQIFTINQGPNCTYTLNPTNANFSSPAQYGGFYVITHPGCTWAATSNVSWITIVDATETGPGGVVYTVQPNTGPERVGTITAGGQTFTITQTSGCNYSISVFSANFPSSGGSGSFTITTNNQNCAWNVLASQQWITITSNPSGIGNGMVTFTVAANNGSARTATIVVVNNLTFQIGQAAPVEIIRAGGRVLSANNKPVRGALVSFIHPTSEERLTTLTNHFGYFFLLVERSQAYNITITHKRYKFSGTRTATYFTGSLIQIIRADPEQ